MHGKGLVHLDVKGANIFIDANTNWLLGDFGSCRPIGEIVLSSTDIFFHRRILGLKAQRAYDIYMLLVTFLIQALDDHKPNFRQFLL
jgi:serine/threonine protein kinase